MNQQAELDGLPQKSFVKGLVVFLSLFGVLYVLRHAFYVFFVLFAGALFAIFLDALADVTRKKTNLSRDLALSIVIVVLLISLGISGWLMGSSLADQLSKLVKRMPQAMSIIRSSLSRYEWGKSLLTSLPTPEEFFQGIGGLIGNVTGIFSTTIGGLAGVFFVLFSGIYLVFEPELYIEGFLHLFPAEKKDRTREVLKAIVRALRWWLLGRAFSMLAVGLLTMTGLFIIGMPLAPTLGLISGLLTFIPFLGPWLSIAPALLVALVEGPLMIVSVVVVYIVVQQLENHIITPLVQKEAVFIPPVVLLAAQVLIGIVFGFIGLLLATPLSIVSVILVQMLYVEDVLDESIKILGTHSDN